jgi:hypothetical protein
MSCATPPANNSQQIRSLENRVRHLEAAIAGIKELTGVCMEAADFIVPLYSSVFNPNGTFSIKFASVPGEVYQVQKSTDGITWVAAVPASIIGESCDCPYPEPSQFTEDNGDPQFTTWTSTETWSQDTVPVYFRVRSMPRAIICAPSKPC